jgi:hypothetical protein
MSAGEKLLQKLMLVFCAVQVICLCVDPTNSFIWIMAAVTFWGTILVFNI